MVDFAIIGAGPYGLSLAAHMKARGAEFRIFGKPMDTWQTQMPEDMLLKSEGFASSLFEPESRVTLERYCQDNKLPYADLGLPVRRDTFVNHGLDFQRRLIPTLENKLVTSLRRNGSGFEIELDSGETLKAREVIAAIGICHFPYTPPVLAALPKELATHTSDHTKFDRFRGQEVTVVGGGASAADVAAALHLAGASVRLVARKSVVHFHNPPDKNPKTVLERLRFPITGIGPGWKSWLCVKAPLLFHAMPEKFRRVVVRKHLGPAAGWFVKQHVVGHAKFHLGASVAQAEAQNGRVALQLSSQNGGRETIVSDHVIAGTGYRVDLGRLKFLDSATRSAIRSVDDTPILGTNFESSIPGLYFVGASSANSFGPLVRFAYGAGFTSRRLSRHLVR